MSKKYSLHDKLFSILLIRAIIFTPMHSSFEIENEFSNFDFYESFSSPNECFQIFHNNPTGPNFLLIDIRYEFTSKNTMKVIKSYDKKYQLKRKDKPCKSTNFFPTVGKEYLKMSFVIFIELYYKEEPMAIFIYDFYYGFNISSSKIISTKNNFGLNIFFSDSINERSITYVPAKSEVKSYLRSLPKNENSICIITQNNRKLVLYSSNIPLRKKYIITGIKIEYVKNDSNHLVKEYQAYPCNKETFSDANKIYLIYEVNKNKILLSFMFRKIDIINRIYRNFSASFLNIEFVEITRLKNLPKESQKLFFLKENRAYFPCPKGRNSLIFISESKHVYHAIKSTAVEVSYGVKRIKWFSHYPTAPCVKI